MVSENTNTEKAALRLIARAEQCSAGLTRKLEMRGHKPEIIAEVIEKLTEQKFIDDSRYARLWLNTRIQLPRTPKRLFIGLINKGIRRSDAQTAIDGVLDEETEFDMLKRFAKKHAKKGDKLKYFLKSEGFSSQAIKRFLE